MEEGNMAQRSFLIKAGIIVGSGGLIFGYDIGVIAGTLTKLGSTFDLDAYEEGLVVAILYVGSILGSIVGGPMCDYFGRWKTIHIQNFLFCIGSVITGLATNLTMLCIGRFIVGIASAVSGIADVPYLNEISPPQFRGVLSSQYEMAVSVGVLLSFAVALALSGLDYGWRIAFVIPSAMAVMQSCGMGFLPESPRWLLEKGLLEKTNKALSAMYGPQFLTHCSCLDRDNDDVPVEVREYLRACERSGRLAALTAAMENEEAGTQKTFMVGRPVGANQPGNRNDQQHLSPTSALVMSSEEGRDGSDAEQAPVLRKSAPAHANSSFRLLQGSTALRAVIQQEQHTLRQYQYPIYLIIVIQILAQVTGGNVIRNYAPTIFEEGGVSTTMSLIFNLLFGVIKTIFTFLSIAYIDHTGRLQLLVYGIVLVGAGMLFLAVCSLTSPSGNISNVPAFVVGCAMVYAGFGLGYGPVPWVLSAELFPTLIRGRIMSLSLLASNISQLVVNFLFLPMTHGITTAGTFFLFAALNVATFLFIKKFLVETKEIAPEVILKSLLDRYHHSADKLVAVWPAVLGPAVAFCCCVSNRSRPASEELAAAVSATGASAAGMAEDCANSTSKGKLCDNAQPSTPLLATSPTHRSAGASTSVNTGEAHSPRIVPVAPAESGSSPRARAGKGIHSASVQNPMNAQRSPSIDAAAGGSGSGRKSAENSEVGTSTSKLTLLSAVDGGAKPTSR